MNFRVWTITLCITVGGIACSPAENPALQSGERFIDAFYAWQPYFLELLNRDAVWVAGVVSALMSVAMIRKWREKKAIWYVHMR